MKWSLDEAAASDQSAVASRFYVGHKCGVDSSRPGVGESR